MKTLIVIAILTALGAKHGCTGTFPYPNKQEDRR